MLAFPIMIAGAAKQAGMKVPPDVDNDSTEDFPHFRVFCTMQLGRPMRDMGGHWENAKIIAAIPDDKIKLITAEEILNMGWHE